MNPTQSKSKIGGLGSTGLSSMKPLPPILLSNSEKHWIAIGDRHPPMLSSLQPATGFKGYDQSNKKEQVKSIRQTLSKVNQDHCPVILKPWLRGSLTQSAHKVIPTPKPPALFQQPTYRKLPEGRRKGLTHSAHKAIRTLKLRPLFQRLPYRKLIEGLNKLTALEQELQEPPPVIPRPTYLETEGPRASKMKDKATPTQPEPRKVDKNADLFMISEEEEESSDLESHGPVGSTTNVQKKVTDRVEFGSPLTMSGRQDIFGSPRSKYEQKADDGCIGLGFGKSLTKLGCQDPLGTLRSKYEQKNDTSDNIGPGFGKPLTMSRRQASLGSPRSKYEQKADDGCIGLGLGKLRCQDPLGTLMSKYEQMADNGCIGLDLGKSLTKLGCQDSLGTPRPLFRVTGDRLASSTKVKVPPFEPDKSPGDEYEYESTKTEDDADSLSLDEEPVRPIKLPVLKTAPKPKRKAKLFREQVDGLNKLNQEAELEKFRTEREIWLAAKQEEIKVDFDRKLLKEQEEVKARYRAIIEATTAECRRELEILKTEHKEEMEDVTMYHKFELETIESEHLEVKEALEKKLKIEEDSLRNSLYVLTSQREDSEEKLETEEDSLRDFLYALTSQREDTEEELKTEQDSLQNSLQCSTFHTEDEEVNEATAGLETEDIIYGSKDRLSQGTAALEVIRSLLLGLEPERVKPNRPRSRTSSQKATKVKRDCGSELEEKTAKALEIISVCLEGLHQEMKRTNGIAEELRNRVSRLEKVRPRSWVLPLNWADPANFRLVHETRAVYELRTDVKKASDPVGDPSYKNTF